MRNKSKITRWSRKVKDKNYDRGYIHIPTEVLRKGPFKYGDEVQIIIDSENKCLIIQNLKKQNAIPQDVKKTLPLKEENTQNQRKEEDKKPIKSTATIKCPQCEKDNILQSKYSLTRRCSFCGFLIKKENFIMVDKSGAHDE